MLRNRWIVLVGVIVVIGVLVWGWRRSGTTSAAIDLVTVLPAAQKQAGARPVEDAIKTVTVTINGETKTCILQQAPARIRFKIVPPADGWFTASIALDPQVWDKEGDGVLFRFGIGDGKGGYEELLNQHVNPAGNPADRRWIPVSLDLSAYAGREIQLTLNTDSSLPGKPADGRNDLALWASPTIVVGR